MSTLLRHTATTHRGSPADERRNLASFAQGRIENPTSEPVSWDDAQRLRRLRAYLQSPPTGTGPLAHELAEEFDELDREPPAPGACADTPEGDQ